MFEIGIEEIEKWSFDILSFLSGFCIIAKITYMICNLLSTLFPNDNADQQVEPFYKRFSDETKFSDIKSSTVKNNFTIGNLKNPCKHCNLTLDTKKLATNANPKETQNISWNFINILFICSLLETICILSCGIILNDTRRESYPNILFCSNAEDCTFTTGSFLKSKNFSSQIVTFVLCFTSGFLVVYLLTKHCFEQWYNCLVSTLIIITSLSISRCFGFVLFTVILRLNTSLILQRILGIWGVFIPMCCGIFFKLKREGRKENITSINSNANRSSSRLKEESGYRNKSKKKPISSQPNIPMTFPNDSFIPCVVLTTQQVPCPYNHHNNIGILSKSRRTHRRASLDVIKERINNTAKWSNMIEHRRTSLPSILASSKRKAVMSSVLVDTTTLVEVHSTIEDFSQNQQNVDEFVKKLQGLLKPYKVDHVKPRQVVWLHDNNTDGSDDETICLSPRHSVVNKRNTSRRSDWIGGQRDLFSTTTTATGLPTEEPAPLKPKRIPKISKEKTPQGTPIDSRCTSPLCESPTFNTGRRSTYPNLPSTGSFFSAGIPHSYANKISSISSDYESCDNDEATATNHHTRSKSVNEAPVEEDICDNSYNEKLNITADSNEKVMYYPSPVRTHISPPSDELTIPEVNESLFRSSSWCESDLPDEGNDLFNDYQEKLLESVQNWNFQIFELAEKTSNVLSQMAFKLFQDTGLFETFNIPKQEFVNYMRALECGYQQIPYHNRIHAADVLHGCWYLSTQPIAGFQGYSPIFSSDSSDSDSGTGVCQTRQVSNIGHGSLAQAIPALELMSLYLAAATHDYDHPGRTNAFLVETRHPLAILYNDRSVLENHHASASWELLYSNKKFNFLRNLETAEWKRLRFLIVEAILATDLKKHFEILSQFNEKSKQRLRSTSSEDGDATLPPKHGINWSADEDRLLVCQMVIKLSDIGGPAKLRPLHITWTKAICEEFFIQGDEERELGSTVSPFMDRNKPQVAELQRTFINNLIKPIVTSMHKTGILAGEINQPEEECSESLSKSLLLEQLKENLNFWKVKPQVNGHDEMNEAFLLAIPVDLNSSKSATTNSSVPHQNPHQTSNNNFSYGAKLSTDQSDDVFQSSNSERQKVAKNVSQSDKQKAKHRVIKENSLRVPNKHTHP